MGRRPVFCERAPGEQLRDRLGRADIRASDSKHLLRQSLPLNLVTDSEQRHELNSFEPFAHTCGYEPGPADDVASRNLEASEAEIVNGEVN
jgi:hypothetical protein